MTVSPYKLASVLLQYPTAALFDGVSTLEAETARLPRPAAVPLGRFLRWLQATPPSAVAQHYVATFDLRRRCALYLTYYRYGDTRNRGAPPASRNSRLPATWRSPATLSPKATSYSTCSCAGEPPAVASAPGCPSW